MRLIRVNFWFMSRERPKGVGVRSFKTLLPYMRPHWWKVVGGTAFLILIDLAQVVMPRFIAPALDNVAEQGRHGNILLLVLAILGAGALISLGRFFWRYWLSGTGIRVTTDLRKDLLEHLQKLSYSFFNKQQVGDLMAYATNDLDAIFQAMTFGFIMLVDVVFLGVMNIIAMVTLQMPATGYLSIFTLIPLAVLMAVIVQFGPMLRTRWKEVRDSFSAMSARVSENVSGIRVVKAYGQEEGETDSFRLVSKDYVRQNINLIKVWGLLFPIIMFLSGISFFLVLLLGGRYMILGQLTVGNFTAFQLNLAMVIWPMSAIGWLMNMIQSGAASMARVNSILDTVPDIADTPDTLPVERIEGNISFNRLTFAYPGVDHPALEDISFNLKPGKILGIIGTLGAGKSTLVSLIPRLYEAPGGTIEVDGHEISRVPLKVLREAIGMVPQDTFLFSQTVKENIGFGVDREVSQEEIERAARIAGIHDEILEFPQGYDTLLGERGVTVSGGQKQRLTIARAVLTDPRILILDDPLSAVDADTEIEILTALKGIMRERAVILVSARPRSLAFADEILVLDAGKIVERGTHEELIRLDGLYALFARLQGLK